MDRLFGHTPAIGQEYYKVLPRFPPHTWRRYRLESISRDGSGILMASMVEVANAATRRPIALVMLNDQRDWLPANKEIPCRGMTELVG